VAGKSGLSAGCERAVLRKVGYVVGYSSREGGGCWEDAGAVG
jgi:hypothetical protein